MGVAQLAEHLTVAQVVGGSNPLTHPSNQTLITKNERPYAVIDNIDHSIFYVLIYQMVRTYVSVS